MRTDILSYALASEKRKQIVKTLFSYPERLWSCSALEEVTKLSHPTVFRTLRDLQYYRVLHVTRVSKKNIVYKLEIGSPFITELQRAMNVYKITAEKVADEFASMIKMYVNIILLYGSTVRGGMTPESDIDILVIVKDKTNINKIQDSAGELSVKIGKPISVVVMTTAEFNKEKKKQFIQSVRENHKVLYGKSPF